MNKTDTAHHLYVDIETTGFSRQKTILYMIGCGFMEDDRLHVTQWFNDDGISEPAILEAFSKELKKVDRTLVTFNGDQFDLPYLKCHYEMNQLPSPLDNCPSLDLYRLLRPYQKLYSMKHGRQKDWEQLMGITREDTKNGGELIQVYKDYLLQKDQKGADKMLDMLYLHNYEDICHLYLLSSLTALDSMTKGKFQFEDANFTKKTDSAILEFTCRLEAPLPTELSVSTPKGSVYAYKTQLKLSVPIFADVMKHYYKDYNNYYYLPEEDRAVHKSIGRYVEKEYRKKCTPDKCYIKKEGVFLPFYSQKQEPELHLSLYRPDYNSTINYIEFDELLEKGIDDLTNYLTTTLCCLLS
jgi:hypothetical protein